MDKDRSNSNFRWKIPNCIIIVNILLYLLTWILRGISDEVMVLACMLPANEGAEEAGHHPLELVPEDAVDDEVDRAVDRHQEVVSLC